MNAIKNKEIKASNKKLNALNKKELKKAQIRKALDFVKSGVFMF